MCVYMLTHRLWTMVWLDGELLEHYWESGGKEFWWKSMCVKYECSPKNDLSRG